MMDRLDLFMQYRQLLFAIAYRMLGSVMEAEDIVQEAFLRWQGAAEVEVQSPKAYLTAIVTRLAIDHQRLACVKREEYIGPWLPEPLLTDLAHDAQVSVMQAESLSTAFLLLMESLTPIERAVFLLREVFDYSYAEIASGTGESEANCRQLLHRARQSIAAKRTRSRVSREQQQRLLSQFIQTCNSGDMEGLLALLADDITFWSDGGGKVSAALNLVHGALNVGRFVLGLPRKAPAGFVGQPAEVNGQPAMIGYVNSQVYAVLTLQTTPDRIHGIYLLINPDKFKGVPPLAAM